MLLVHVVLTIFRFGPDDIVFYSYCAGGLFIFYTGNWEEYHCDVMRTNIGGFGVTELHWLIIAFFTVNGITNNQFSKITLGEFGAMVNVDVK